MAIQFLVAHSEHFVLRIAIALRKVGILREQPHGRDWLKSQHHGTRCELGIKFEPKSTNAVMPHGRHVSSDGLQ